MARSVEIVLRTKEIAKTAQSVKMLRAIIKERSGITIKNRGAEFKIVLEFKKGIGDEGFSIKRSKDKMVIISGNDEKGLLYGGGKFLITSRYEKNNFIPGTWQGKSVPEKKVRAMYFATHFHNFYHDAPVKEVVKYVEELALYGCNVLLVWFDMHHFKGLNDPEAQKMIKRLKIILKAANNAGMDAALGGVSNEGYSTTPGHLKAEWAVQNGYFEPPADHYHVEICPNRAGGTELIGKLRFEMLRAFKGLNIKYFFLWPYDQGGCTCEKCSPWGFKGHLLSSREAAKQIKKVFPFCKIILSTWYFDHFVGGEWAGLEKAFDRKELKWVDYFLMDDNFGFPEYPVKHQLHKKMKIVGFPEISMKNMAPWGGFGSNPRPVHFGKYWNTVKNFYDGSFPYSEGIFEDINKYMILQMEWSKKRNIREIVKEYVSFFFSPKVADKAVKAVYLLEENMKHWLTSTAGDDAGFKKKLYKLEAVDRTAVECYKIVREIEKELPIYIRKQWRWRIFYLRAALDLELFKSKGKATRNSEKYFKELSKIYHAKNGQRSIRPPEIACLKKYWRAGSTGV